MSRCTVYPYGSGYRCQNHTVRGTDRCAPHTPHPPLSEDEKARHAALSLDQRTCNVLKRAGIRSARVLRQCSAEDLLDIRSMGRKGLTLIQEKLAACSNEQIDRWLTPWLPEPSDAAVSDAWREHAEMVAGAS